MSRGTTRVIPAAHGTRLRLEILMDQGCIVGSSEGCIIKGLADGCLTQRTKLSADWHDVQPFSGQVWGSSQLSVCPQ